MRADDLFNAMSINTEGKMQGIWNRTKSEKNSQLVFESETDPGYTISFEKVWSLTVKIGGEEGDKSSQYIWDSATRSLSEKPLVIEGEALSVEILHKDPGEDKEAKIHDLTNELELKNKEIHDLKNTLESMLFICRNQEKNLLELVSEGRRVRDKVKKKSASNIDPDEKPLFLYAKIPASEDPGRGAPVHMDSNHYVSTGLPQAKASSVQTSNAANIVVGKSSVDQMYRRDHPRKSSVPSGNPYANYPPEGDVNAFPIGSV